MSPKKRGGKSSRWRPGPAEIEHFRQLNQICLDLQRATLNELLDISDALVGRLKTGDDPFLADFEVEVEFQFYLREDSPEWRDDADNIVATVLLDFCLPYVQIESDIDFLSDNRSWNDMPEIICCGLGGENICYLAHKLVREAFSKEKVRQIYEIDTIWSDIHLRLQGIKYHPRHHGERFHSNKPEMIRVR